MKALIISINETSVIPNAERFFPDAKVGNLKDPAKIQVKVAEHQEKLRSEAATHSLYAQAKSVTVCLVELADKEQQSLTGPSGKAVVGETQTFALPDECEALQRFLAPLTDVRMILGPHPTTQSRRLQNEFIRAKVGVPPCFARQVERVNVFRELCTDSEGEYPECLAPLGVRASNPIDDTVTVARLLHII